MVAYFNKLFNLEFLPCMLYIDDLGTILNLEDSIHKYKTVQYIYVKCNFFKDI